MTILEQHIAAIRGMLLTLEKQYSERTEIELSDDVYYPHKITVSGRTYTLKQHSKESIYPAVLGVPYDAIKEVYFTVKNATQIKVIIQTNLNL